MSPLSNRKREAARSAENLDIRISRYALSAQHYCGSVHHKLWEKEWTLSGKDVFDEGGNISEIVIHAIREIDKMVGRSSPSIRLILPDPYVDHRLVITDDLPNKKRDQEAFIRWILKDQYFLDSDDHAIDYSIVEDNEKYLISVFSIKNEWVSLMCEFGNNNLLIGSICSEMFSHLLQVENVSNGYFVYQNESFIGSTFIDSSGKIRSHGSKFCSFDDTEGRTDLLKRIKRDYLSLHDNGDGAKSIKLYVIGAGCEMTTVEGIFGGINYICVGGSDG